MFIMVGDLFVNETLTHKFAGKRLMNPKKHTVRVVFSFVFSSAFGIGMWYNGASMLIAILGSLVMWCIGVGMGCAILLQRRLRCYREGEIDNAPLCVEGDSGEQSN